MAATQHVDALIASGQTVSAGFDLGGYELVALQFPAAFQGTTAAFNAAEFDGGVYLPVFDSAGAQVSLVVAAGRTVVLSTLAAQAVAKLRFMKLVAGAAQTQNVAVRVLVARRSVQL